MRPLLHLALGCLLLCLPGQPAPARGPAAGAMETSSGSELEAALVYKFSLFVRWPAEAFENDEAPVTYAILGSEDTRRHLERMLLGRSVGGRTTRVVVYRSIEDVEAPHVLFVDAAWGQRLDELRTRLGDAPVLLVGRRPRFAHEGGIINLYERGGSLRFEINPARAKQVHLEISAKLLRLARIIEL